MSILGMLSNHGMESGESGAAGLAGLLAGLSLPNNPLNLSITSEVLLINTEGITDHDSHQNITMSKL